MNTIRIDEMSDSQFNSLLNAVIEERARREKVKKTELWDEFCAIYTKIVKEGFKIYYRDDYFDIDDIDIC